MQVFFNSREADGGLLRDLAVRRVHFVMRRLKAAVPRASVQLADLNGPRGGVDKRCTVQLKTDGGRTVVVTSTARDWRDALDSALARANRVLLRRGQRAGSQRTRGLRTATALDD
jgi:hypothetical protein